MEYFTFVDLETARLVRKAYIDSLISSMIRLETDPHVVVWIDRLRGCRERDWNDEVRDIIRNAILTYNARWAVVYGGKGSGMNFGKLLGKALSGLEKGLKGEQGEGTIETIISAATQKIFSTGAPQTGGVIGDSSDDEGDLRAALHAELQRMSEVESAIQKHI